MTFRDPNGNELQFNGEFAITKQAVSLFSGSIKGDVSITFSVDNNSANREVLNYQGPQMLNQIAFTKQPFSRINKGNFLDQGYIVIQGEDGDQLNCFYVSGNSNWLQLLSGLITELDFSGKLNGKNYNTLFDKSTIVSLSSSTEGIAFPFVDWCFAKKKGNNIYIESGVDVSWVDIDNDPLKPVIQFYPCFYLHSLTSEIFNQSDIKKDGNLFSDTLYKSMALPPVDGQIKRTPFKKVLLNGTSQTYSAGLGTAEKIKGLTVRQSDPETWDDINKRFITPIQAGFYIYVTLTSGSATSVRVARNGRVILGSGTTLTLGVKKRVQLSTEYINAVPVAGDYYELYALNNITTPFTASFDIEYEIPEVILSDDYINPGNFLPSIQSIDIIKFLVNLFGCAVYFDSTSKTITLTIIEKLRLEDAYDWSEYFVSHSSDYSDNAAHNFITWASSSDSVITKYNQINTLKFGDGDMRTTNTLLEQKEIAKLPFAPSASSLCFNNVYCLDIPLINLVDEGDPIDFTSIAVISLGLGTSRFTTGVPSVLNGFEVVRITNGDGVNIGYYMAVDGGGGATYEDITFPFVSTDTGKIWRQKINYQKVEPRVISIAPSKAPTDFAQAPIYSVIFGTPTQITSLAYATFTKNFTGLPIDQWKNNLAIDNPNAGNFTDPTIKELYFNKISRFIKNPKIRAVMLLPDSVYQRFKFDQFIYLKTEKLTGYFFVDSIINYVDSNTPVEINLYML